jgi:hypothetical protein
MTEPKKKNGMLPLILVGLGLFGVGVFQSMQPKVPEVNTGFVAPTETPKASLDNPRTMQAPEAPALTKDAAQRAAETDTTTKIDVEVNGAKVKLSTTDAPWLKGIMSGALGNFRDGVLGSLKAEQAKGDVNCAPVLTDMVPASFATIEKIECTAKDGAQIVGDFDDVGDGELQVDYSNGGKVMVSKNDGAFKVETRNSE